MRTETHNRVSSLYAQFTSCIMRGTVSSVGRAAHVYVQDMGSNPIQFLFYILSKGAVA